MTCWLTYLCPSWLTHEILPQLYLQRMASNLSVIASQDPSKLHGRRITVTTCYCGSPGKQFQICHQVQIVTDRQHKAGACPSEIMKLPLDECRYLHILGQLGRFGADLLDGRQLDEGTFQLAACLETVLSYFDKSKGDACQLCHYWVLLLPEHFCGSTLSCP